MSAAGTGYAEEFRTTLLSRHLALRDLVGDVRQTMQQLPRAQASTGVAAALARIGRHAGVDPVYVFRADGDVMHNTHEWCADGIAPEIDNLQGVPVAAFHAWLGALTAGLPVSIPDVDALADDRAEERDMLQGQGIRSLLVVPMTTSAGLEGFVGFDAVRERRRFHAGEVMLLRSVADVVRAVLVS